MNGTGIFRKVLKLDGSSDSFYAMEELSQEDKKFIDKINASAMQQEWEVEENCIQELYSNILFNMHYEFAHKGYEYFITFDSANKKQIWTIYERDLTNPKYCYNTIWETEPRTDYSDLPALVFEFILKNDGRTIAEYCCDCWKQPRLLVPEPINENFARKIWRH